MESVDNRRRNLRYIRHDKLFVQVLAASESFDISGRTLPCLSVDASVDGLRVEIDTEISVNSMVDLWASFQGVEEKFYLRGHVCWCYELGGDDDRFQVGIELDDGYATDYTRWVELIQSFSEKFDQPLC